MKETKESIFEFETENERLIKDYSEEKKKILYKMLSPSLTLYVDGENIFPCYFDFGSIHDYGGIEEQWYEVSDDNRTLTIYIKYFSESDIEYKYVFEISDEHTLKYLQSESSELRGVDSNRLSLPDKAIFVLEE